MRLEQETVDLHHAVDAFGIGAFAPVFPSLAAQQGMHAAIAVGRQIGDDRTNVGEQIGIGQWWPPAGSGRRPMVHGGQVLAADADRLGDRGHRFSPGNEVERNSCFFGPAARDTASRRISASMVFLPSRR